MTLSPKKYVSNYTTSTAQRGVEAKEVELANTNLELDMSNSTHFPAESSAGSVRRGGDAAPPHLASNDETGSYLQVVVEKHRRKRSPPCAAAVAAQTSPRLPAASSPLTHNQGGHGDVGGVERGMYVLPHPVLLACPTTSPMCPALQAHTYYTRRGSRALMNAAAAVRSCDRGASLDERDERDAADKSAGDGGAALPPPHQLQKKNKTWKMFRDFGTDKLSDNEPDRVEVYYFEHGSGEFLATCGGSRPAALERAARRGGRLATALLAELLAAPQLLLALPVALLLHVQRCLLVALRGAATGLLQTTSDYMLKPALALTFNALVQPVLVFCTNVARGVREALRPLALALGDAVEPAARLLAAVRLVDVQLACGRPPAPV